MAIPGQAVTVFAVQVNGNSVELHRCLEVEMSGIEHKNGL